MPTLPSGLVLKGALTDPRGRSIAAGRIFEPGELIATFGIPSISIPDSLHLSTTCSGCLLPATDESDPPPQRVVRACTGCQTVAYCSPACQKVDWTTGGHKAECKVFKRVQAASRGSLPTTVRALIQVFLRPEMSTAMGELEGHIDDFRQRSPKLWGDMELQARAALHYLRREASAENLAGAIDILCKITVNSFNRRDEDTEDSGLFINPALAMINHSCIPNAFVQAIGRKAVLHAYRRIGKDEEIEISYIDCHLPRSARQDTLKTQFDFTCNCPRCKDDMDVYQVHRMYPHLNLNSLSLAPGIQKQDLHNPSSLIRSESFNTTLEEIYRSCSTPMHNLGVVDRRKELRRRWAACKPLRDLPTPAYAVEPLSRVFQEASIYFTEQGNHAYCLCISIFLALRVHPYQWAAPFAPNRVKGVHVLAKLLGGYEPADLSGPGTLAPAISKVIEELDQTTVCQALLELVIHHAPAAHSKEWFVFRGAKMMLDQVEAIQALQARQGLKTGHELVKAYMRNPNGPGEKSFFEQVILSPLRELSTLCVKIMDNEFSS